jgi:hypothetical protein
LFALCLGAALAAAPSHTYAQDSDVPPEGSVEAQRRQRDAEGDPSAQRSGDGAGSAASETETDTEIDESEMSDEDLIAMMEEELEEEDGDEVGDEETGDDDDDFGPADSLGFDSLGSALGGTEDGIAFNLPLFGESTFSLVNTTITELRSNDFEDGQFMRDDSLAWTLIERMQLILQGETLRAEVRIDAFVPFVGPSDCSSAAAILCDLSWDLRPERMNILWTPTSAWSVQLGDAHAVLARGISVSMRKLDQLGIDTTVRGGYVQYDQDHFYFRALGGVSNPQNLDPLTLEINQDPVDVLAGGEVGFRLGANQELEVGFHATHVWFEGLEEQPSQTNGAVAGWHAAAPALLGGTLALYTEINAMVRQDQDPDRTQERRWGRAVYASAQITQGNTSILAQWKDYSDYVLRPLDNIEAYRIYSAAPSLDFDTERYSGIENSRGGQLELTYTLNPSPWALTLTGVGYGHTEDHRTDPWDGNFTGHGLLSLTKLNDSTTDSEVGWTLDLIGGYRREVYMDDAASATGNAGELHWEVIHAIVDVNIGLGAHSFEIRLDPRLERKRRPFPAVIDPDCSGLGCNPDHQEYVRGGAYLTWSFAGRIHLSANLQWNSENAIRSTLYPGGEVRWEFVRGSHVRVFVGQTPGGLLCSGGVCRDVPVFEGGLLELVLRI